MFLRWHGIQRSVVLFSLLAMGGCGGSGGSESAETAKAVRALLSEDPTSLSAPLIPSPEYPLDAATINKQLVYSEKIELSLLTGVVKDPSAYRLRFSKTSSENPKDAKELFTLLEGTKILGHPSVLYPAEQTDYFLEVWFQKNLLFHGGFNDPLKIRYEREREEGVWEHHEFALPEGIFTLKIPAVPEGSEIKIYKVLQQ